MSHSEASASATAAFPRVTDAGQSVRRRQGGAARRRARTAVQLLEGALDVPAAAALAGDRGRRRAGAAVAAVALHIEQSAAAAREAWVALTRVGPAAPYELAPTAAELRDWRQHVARLVTGLETAP